MGISPILMLHEHLGHSATNDLMRNTESRLVLLPY